jgi:hypothetical protein
MRDGGKLNTDKAIYFLTRGEQFILQNKIVK